MTEIITYCRSGISWNVTNGNNISLWNDHWIINNISLRHLIQGPIPKHELNKSVASLISNSVWDISSLSFILPPQIISFINNTPIFRNHQGVDTPYWHFTSDGNFTSSSAYLYILYQNNHWITKFPPN